MGEKEPNIQTLAELRIQAKCDECDHYNAYYQIETDHGTHRLCAAHARTFLKGPPRPQDVSPGPPSAD